MGKSTLYPGGYSALFFTLQYVAQSHVRMWNSVCSIRLLYDAVHIRTYMFVLNKIDKQLYATIMIY